jgi:hypothetical protein
MHPCDNNSLSMIGYHGNYNGFRYNEVTKTQQQNGKRARCLGGSLESMKGGENRPEHTDRQYIESSTEQTLNTLFYVV